MLNKQYFENKEEQIQEHDSTISSKEIYDNKFSVKLSIDDFQKVQFEIINKEREMDCLRNCKDEIEELERQIDISTFISLDLYNLPENSNSIDVEIIKRSEIELYKLIELQKSLKDLLRFKSLLSIMSVLELKNLLSIIDFERLCTINPGSIKHIVQKILVNNPIIYRFKLSKVSYKICLAAKIDKYSKINIFDQYFQEKIIQKKKKIPMMNTRRGGIKARIKRTKLRIKKQKNDYLEIPEIDRDQF